MVTSKKVQPNLSTPLAESEPVVLASQFSTKELLGAGGIFLLFIVLYSFTMARTNVGYTDSDLFLTVAQHLGLAHPPGYAWYVLLLHFFMNLPIPWLDSPIEKGHFLSVLLQAGALSLLFLAIIRCVAYLQIQWPLIRLTTSPILDKWFLSLSTTLMLGTSFLYWLYGLVAEKYSLNSFAVALFLLLTIWLLTTKKSSQKLWQWLAWSGVVTFLFAYHYSNWALIPMVAVFLKQTWNSWKQWKIYMLTISIVMILSSIGVTWLLNNNNSPVSWHFEPSLYGLWQHLSRQVFRVSEVSTSTDQAVGSFFSKEYINYMIQTTLPYSETLVRHFSWIGLALAILGLCLGNKVNKELRIPLGMGILGAAICLPLILGLPENFGTQATVMRQYLIGYNFLPFLWMIGLWIIGDRLRRISELTKKISATVFTFLIIGVPSFFIAWRAYSVYPQVNLHNYSHHRRLMETVIKDVPKNALLGCFNDMTCFTLLYLQKVEGVRKDVTLVPSAYPLVWHELKEMEDLRGFDYEKNPFLQWDILTWNIGKRPVYVVDLPEEQYSMLGIGLSFSYIIPSGYVGELVRKVPDRLPETDYALSFAWEDYPITNLDDYRSWARASIARLHKFNATIYEKIGDREKARDELNIAADLLFQVPQVSAEEIEGMRRYIESSHQVETYRPGSTPQATTEVYTAAVKFYKEGRYGRAYQGALGILVQEPKHEEGRILLARSLEKMDNVEQAKIEYQNVLKYHSENKIAKKALERLSK